MFRYESEKELNKIVLDLHKRGIDTSALETQKDKEEFWEGVTSELLLEKESLDRLKELDPFEILLRSKNGFPQLDCSSIVTGQKIPNVPPLNSSYSSTYSVHITTTIPVIMARNAPPPLAAPTSPSFPSSCSKFPP